MPYVDVNFERNGTIIKTTAKVSTGWNGSKPSHQFYGEEKLDYRLGFELRVAVWMAARDPNGRVCRADNFPTELVGSYETRLIRASIADGRLALSVSLSPELPWIQTSNGKLAVDWQPGPIATHKGISFDVRHMIVFNLPSVKKGDYKEWDLLPFLPGGLLESNRRRH
ncbi:MAG: hypothetical protein WA734_09040 [Candidatus Acidiferrales bacterium]